MIGSRYEIGTLLGEGGMGAVYRGTDSRSGGAVAIKRLKPELVANADLLARFASEAEALRVLNHPNIVKVLATVQENGQHYIVMEYVPGGSLYDLLRKTPRLPISRVLEIALDLSDELRAAPTAWPRLAIWGRWLETLRARQGEVELELAKAKGVPVAHLRLGSDGGQAIQSWDFGRADELFERGCRRAKVELDRYAEWLL